MSDKKYAPLHPYIDSMEFNSSMYDNIPYTRDYDLTGEGSVRLISGNVLKSYTYQVKPDQYSLDNKDSVFLELLEKKKKEEQQRKAVAAIAKADIAEVEDTEPSLSKEQWEGLMMDTKDNSNQP